jgi:hypothetical protein
LFLYFNARGGYRAVTLTPAAATDKT